MNMKYNIQFWAWDLLLLFSCSVMYDSLQLLGLQGTRLPCPILSPRVCSKLRPIELILPFNHFILCRPLSLLPAIFPSIRVFSNMNIMWPKYWNFSISLSNEYSGLIFCRTDWFDLLVIQGTLKSLLQHHSSKVLILWCSVFFMVQLKHGPGMPCVSNNQQYFYNYY